MFSGWFWGNLLVAVVGAVILLTAIKMVRGRST
ncbi:MAG: GlsB/YeaQ/YmgE family stress response membrane protein [Alphaproteobacteria bacterium]|nr:MAG: GlsB/YeaQ/YmgE family stress response membrane protein [Alphaproteobacteria bacterium]